MCRIQQAWKKYKGNAKYHSQQQLDVLTVDTYTCCESASVTQRNGQYFETLRECDCQALHTSNNERTDKQNPLCNKSCDNLSTPSVSVVEQLASHVKSVLLQDNAELEMFEIPEYGCFGRQTIKISQQSKAPVVNVGYNQVTQTANDDMLTQVAQTSRVEQVVLGDSQPNTIAVKQGETEEMLQCEYDLSWFNTFSSHDMCSTHTVKDSMYALEIRTGHDYSPTSMKLLDEKTLKFNKERVMSPEERYRLCYTIELSDSSSEEDKNNGTPRESGGFPGTLSRKFEANTVLNGHYHQGIYTK